jgi:hypothetical protein
VRPKVLYIVGAGRSGSTLLERLISDRGDVAAVGELLFLWDRGLAQDQSCSCEQPFTECPFWSKIMADLGSVVGGRERLVSLASTRSRVDRNRYVPQMHLARTRSHSYAKDYRAFESLLGGLYRTISKVSGDRLILDSSKAPSYAHLLSTSSEIDVAFINLVRDSRAVAYSWRRAKVRPEIRWERTDMDVWPYAKAATDWNTKYLLSTLLKLVARKRVLTLRYETVVKDPDSALALIGAHLATNGIQHPALAVGPQSVRPSIYHTVSGNPIRFDKSSPVVVVDDEWRSAMPRKNRIAVAAMTGPFLAHHRIAVARGNPKSR